MKVVKMKMYSIEPKPKNSTFNDEQWQAIQLKGNNILVSASAGSGKTTVLIERIFNHIRQGFANVDELLVVTFTEAAANEMKERMESRLKEAVSETLDPEEQKRLIQQLALLPKANIQTLHSFCLEVIQNFFYLIDFNPNFSLVTDATQVQLMYQEVWDDMITAIYETNGNTQPITIETYQALLAQYGTVRSDDSLFEMVTEIYRFARSQSNSQRWLNSAHQLSSNFQSITSSKLYQETIQTVIRTNAIQAVKLLTEASDMMRSLSDESITKYEPIITAELEQAKELYELSQDTNLEDLFQTINAIQFGKWKPNKKTSEDYEIVAEMKGLRDEAKDLITKYITSLLTYDYGLTKTIEDNVSTVIKSLAQLTTLFSERLFAYKMSINMIDYNDLEHLALEILAPVQLETEQRTISSAAYYYQDKFKEVMIDEYQDINDIQNDILTYLSHEKRDDLVKNLFMVGDVKQSIYGFRMAEPSLFLERYANYAKTDEGELIILDKNYRSRDEVLQFTNFIFERLMDRQFGEMEYGHDEALTTGNLSFEPTAPHEDFNIQLLLYEKENLVDEVIEEDTSDEISLVDSSLEAESHIIAQDIQNKIASGYLIYDKKLKQQRPVQYADFVILTPTRKPFLIAQRVLDSYEVPLYAQKVENYFQRQEVQLMLALLKIIDNPLQDIPLVAVLRSFFVQLSDEDLSKIRIHYPNGLFFEAVLSYLDASDDISIDGKIQRKLKRFIGQYKTWQNLSKQISLVELIWTIYQDTSLLDYVAGLNNGVQREANLHALYEKAAEFEQSQYKGVFGFIRYIEKVMQQQNDLAEPVLLDSNQNFVRMMTVHASKGLEFPIVYLMDTAKKFNLQDARTRPYIASKHYGLSTDYMDYTNRVKFTSFVKKAFKIEKENILKAEEMRKLYVALTRCEQKLIIVGVVKNEGDWLDKQESTESKLVKGDKTIPLQERIVAASWLDWIRQALSIPQTKQSVANFDRSQVSIKYLNLDDITKQSEEITTPVDFRPPLDLEKQIAAINLEQLPDNRIYQHLNHIFNYQYSYELATKTSSYQSVSELKRLYEEPRIEKIDYFEDRRVQTTQEREEKEETSSIQGIRYTEDTFQPPRFAEELSQKVSYADIGSATHFLLQQVDFASLENLSSTEVKEELQRVTNSLIESGHIDKKMGELITFDHIVTFINSELGQFTIQHADKVRRELAFSYLTPADKIFRNSGEVSDTTKLAQDQLLVHGVIDNFIELEDEIVIYDYKTDRYKPYINLTKEDQKKQIIDKYRFQISLYSKALSVTYNKPVTQAYVVLLDFGESVLVDLLD